jgi:hypothetical protein
MPTRALACTLALLAAGCGPKMPNEAEARAAFSERRQAIERIEDAVFQLAGMRGPEALDDAAVRAIADAAGALGLQLKGHGSAPPCIGGTATGSVDPSAGLVIDRYRVGYGLYQTAWQQDGVSHGDGAFHPGIAVVWTLGEGGPLAPEATACFLLDGTPRPK